MIEKPLIEAEITFLTHEEGGRSRVPDFSLGRGSYMPHLVVQPPDVRKAAVVDGNIIVDDYLSVAFVMAPNQCIAGQPARFVLELMYYPEVNYDALKGEATFTVREGGKVVGFGKVIHRTQP